MCRSLQYFLGTVRKSSAPACFYIGALEKVLTLCLLDCRRNASSWAGLIGGGGATTDPPGSCLHWPRHGTRDHSHHYSSFCEGAGTSSYWNLQLIISSVPLKIIFGCVLNLFNILDAFTFSNYKVFTSLSTLGWLACRAAPGASQNRNMQDTCTSASKDNIDGDRCLCLSPLRSVCMHAKLRKA